MLLFLGRARVQPHRAGAVFPGGVRRGSSGPADRRDAPWRGCDRWYPWENHRPHRATQPQPGENEDQEGGENIDQPA